VGGGEEEGFGGLDFDEVCIGFEFGVALAVVLVGPIVAMAAVAAMVAGFVALPVVRPRTGPLLPLPVA